MATLKQIRNASGFAGPFQVWKLTFGFADLAGGSGEVDLGVDLPATGVITDIFPHVTTAEATGTATGCDLGLLSSESGGDADGFLDGVTTAATGYVLPSLTNGSVTRGALLREVSGAAGEHSPAGFDLASVTAKSVSFTPGSDDDYAELAAEVYFIIFDSNNRDG